MRVTKRDGTLQEYDVQKIRRAILMAFDTVQPGRIPDIADEIHDINRRCYDLINVEDVQDVVEELLMARFSDVAKHYILYRAERTRAREKREHLKVDPNAIADYIHPAKYARWNGQRRETFIETVDRVQTMHVARFPKLQADIVAAFAQVRTKCVLPSMRSMQFAGPALLQHNARMYNCSFTLVDRLDAFKEIFYLLLCGCGVGYSIQFQHVAKLPPMARVGKRVRHFKIPDSIEGWATAVNILFEGHTNGVFVEFDYSQIRPEGAQLMSGGLAPGHLPLRKLIETMRVLLNRATGRKLRPIECHDIICFIAESVLAGGIRRSSLISLFSPDDGEMMYCKTRERFERQRAMANNSAVFLRDSSYDQFRRVMDLNEQCHGEPGFFFTNNLNYGCNPCGEIGLDPTANPGTGFGFCNLTEVNGAVCDKDQFYKAVEAAAMIGTLQASYTDFPFLSKESEVIAKRDALLGVSITGMADNPELCFDSDVLKYARQIAIDTNKKFARLLGINPAKRVTTIKPSGTASLELGCIGAGIHPHHARRYFRRITANSNEPVAQWFKKHNPHMVEEKPNGDWCLTFCVEAPTDAITVRETNALNFLEHIRMVYKNWIGRGEFTHNVSATVVYDKWQEVVDYVWKYREDFQALTFLPRSSDKILPYMPREEVTAMDEAKWRYLLQHYKPVDYSAMEEKNDGTSFEVECGSRCSTDNVPA